MASNCTAPQRHKRSITVLPLATANTGLALKRKQHGHSVTEQQNASSLMNCPTQWNSPDTSGGGFYKRAATTENQVSFEKTLYDDSILFTSISKDRKYNIVSRCFTGLQLQQVVKQERLAQQTEKRVASIISQSKANPPSVSFQKAIVKKHANGILHSYAYNSTPGLSKKYNEDRVCVTINIQNNEGDTRHFFALYDGHGGAKCCDFLKDRLNKYIILHKDFSNDPRKALSEGIQLCEKQFLEDTRQKYYKTGQIDRSGSCAIVLLIVGTTLYVANTGDSRAILSFNRGQRIYSLSRDHKPADLNEQARILSLGGKIYRTELISIKGKQLNQESKQRSIGPLRVFPGKLSVTRAFGDIEAKASEFGGIPDCVIAEAEIRKYEIQDEHDFIFVGCDGIFDKMSSNDVGRLIWKAVGDSCPDEEQLEGKCVDAVIEESMARRSGDNLSGILVCLKDLRDKGQGDKGQGDKGGGDKGGGDKGQGEKGEGEKGEGEKGDR